MGLLSLEHQKPRGNLIKVDKIIMGRWSLFPQGGNVKCQRALIWGRGGFKGDLWRETAQTLWAEGLLPVVYCSMFWLVSQARIHEEVK